MFRAPNAELSSQHRWGLLVLAILLVFPSWAEAHGISEASRETMVGGGILDYIWLGAEHMVTGYDHLLFLFGVIFFLTGFRDIVRFITAFTLGHCITLLGATLLGITVNAYLIDAVIALSVVYKGFENLDGFKKMFDIQAPNLLVVVFGFGLIHGLGLATRLQELGLGDEGLVSRILAFNVGVELGQVAALTVMLIFFAAWRSSKSFERFGKASNVALVLAGVGLFVFQMMGFAASDHHDHHPGSEAGHEQQKEHRHAPSAADASRAAHGAEAHAHPKKAHAHGEQPHAHGAAPHAHGAAPHAHGAAPHAHGDAAGAHGDTPHAHDEQPDGHEHTH